MAIRGVRLLPRTLYTGAKSTLLKVFAAKCFRATSYPSFWRSNGRATRTAEFSQNHHIILHFGAQTQDPWPPRAVVKFAALLSLVSETGELFKA